MGFQTSRVAAGDDHCRFTRTLRCDLTSLDVSVTELLDAAAWDPTRRERLHPRHPRTIEHLLQVCCGDEPHTIARSEHGGLMLAELRKAAPLVPRVVVSAEAIQHSLAVARREQRDFEVTGEHVIVDDWTRGKQFHTIWPTC